MTSTLLYRHRGWSTNPTCVPTITDYVALGTGSSVLSSLPLLYTVKATMGPVFTEML